MCAIRGEVNKQRETEVGKNKRCLPIGDVGQQTA